MKRFGLFISRAITTTAVAGVVYSGVKMRDIAKREAVLTAQKNELETDKRANAKANASVASSLMKRHEAASLKRQEIEIEIATSKDALEAAFLKLDETKKTESALDVQKKGLIVQVDTLKAEGKLLKEQNTEADAALKVLLARKEELRLEIEDKNKTNDKLETVAAKLGADNVEAEERLEEAKAGLKEANAGLDEAKAGLEEARLQANDQRAASAAKQAPKTQRAREILAEAQSQAADIVRRAREIEEEAETKLSHANTHRALTSSSELQLSELRLELEKNAASLKAQNIAMARQHTAQISRLKAEHQLEIEQMQREVIVGETVKHQRALHAIQAQLYDSRRQQETAAKEIEQLGSENSQFRAERTLLSDQIAAQNDHVRLISEADASNSRLQGELAKHIQELARFERENIRLRATNEAQQQEGTTLLRQAQAQARMISQYEQSFNETRDGSSNKRRLH